MLGRGKPLDARAEFSLTERCVEPANVVRPNFHVKRRVASIFRRHVKSLRLGGGGGEKIAEDLDLKNELWLGEHEVCS